MNTGKQKNKIYFFFSLICVFILSVCFLRKYDGYHDENAHFANYSVAGSDSSGLVYYRDDVNPNKIAVAVGNCTLENIEVTTFNGEDVTEVFPSGFQNCKTIKTISLPDTITAFGTDAFAGSSLESITIPNGLTAISSGAFRN